jgi:hypothetical protein
LGIPSTIKPKRKCFDTKNDLFLEKEVLVKVLSGRTIELDEVVEPEHDEQSGTAPEAVPEETTMPMAPAPTKCCSPGDRGTY